MDGGFEGREDGEGKRSWGRECLWDFSHAGLEGRLDWDVLLSSVFLGSGAGTCGDGNYPTREEDYWNILFGMRVVLVTGEVW